MNAIAEETGNWIYIGPSIPPLGLQRNALYLTKELPTALKLIAERKPAVLALYVNVEHLAAAKNKLTTSGSLEHTANLEMLGIAKTTPH
jgi:hypothetical protein